MKTIYSPAYRALINWLRTSRKAQGVSMRELGIRMRMPHSWIGKVETGERRLDVEEFVRISRALEIDTNQGLSILEAALPVVKPIRKRTS
ncbi:MAG: helix-turn-helix transcriptional regulator [bacterium]|jgi:transcriptional regulator with XRE-family HTH domain